MEVSRPPVVLFCLTKKSILKNSQKEVHPRCLSKEKSIHCAFLLTTKGTLLARAFNDVENHAEINVIEKVKKMYSKRYLKSLCLREKGFVIKVVRFNKKGGYALSKPCDGCSKRIDDCPGIVQIYHS